MDRLPRIVAPGQPPRIIQRGNNREPSLFADEDYSFYLDSLKGASSRHGCRRYVRYINHAYRRTDALWEGRDSNQRRSAHADRLIP